jgi:hypothetical protein
LAHTVAPCKHRLCIAGFRISRIPTVAGRMVILGSPYEHRALESSPQLFNSLALILLTWPLYEVNVKEKVKLAL